MIERGGGGGETIDWSQNGLGGRGYIHSKPAS